MKKTFRIFSYYLLTAIIGSSLVWAFPPHALPWLVFATMTIFLLGLEQRGNNSSFWYGYTFYLGAVIAFIGYWFSYYFRLQLGCGYLVSYALTAIICLYTSLYIGIISHIYVRFKSQNSLFNLVVFFPSLWVLTELIRGLFFPRSWYALGYTQVEATLFGGYYPLFGVYFVSWLIVAMSGGVSYFILQIALGLEKWHKACLKLAVATLVLLTCSSALAMINYTHPYGKPLKIALLQPSVFSSKYYNLLSMLELEEASVTLISQTKADIYVLPETVFGTDYHYLTTGFLQTLQLEMQKNNAILVFGTPIHGKNNLHQTGTVALNDLDNPVYVKHNLVPFGEYNPLKNTFLNPLLMAAVGNQISEYTAGGQTQPPALIKGQRFAFNICYENSINDFVAKSAKNATILLNQSDLSWYGETQMKDAFFQFSQARALENQRYFLQDGNTGDTAIINPKGMVEEKLSPFSAGSLSGRVQGYSGITPFEAIGNSLVWILCCGPILVMLLFRKQQK